ncbi:uncharacterized protein LOC126907679 [Daktulosphaira vitifoliae]|uniref:uncharacterized protein LOC126907679 n=1 Tax=Daktulosphaira vitifoliae TaxID=58002 RepID=UPI0021AAD010|nr:uncharacterized protein LOC126907679 [Daktulosphaira vitifoliae]XP_050545098.1 uncharacterized protein LOC126907679 [Daktulosphaira vitifoliae]XP_050545099.1 uncharacterized protein LOC126907679 [Daktulosphaira vitifoliae]
MSSSTFHLRNISMLNNENPVKNIKESQLVNRKKTALKVLTNTVQSAKKSDGKGLKVPKVLPMKKFETQSKCRSPLQDITHDQMNEDITHFGCMKYQEKDCLPSNMTSNISMLSDFFNTHSFNEEDDWFIEDYKNTMVAKIKNTFEYFEKPDIEMFLSPLPIMEFPEVAF